MDLNYLLSRHQVSVHKASMASSPEARHAHKGLMSGYANRIRALQLTLGARALLAEVA